MLPPREHASGCGGSRPGNGGGRDMHGCPTAADYTTPVCFAQYVFVSARKALGIHRAGGFETIFPVGVRLAGLGIERRPLLLNLREDVAWSRGRPDGSRSYP